MMCNICTCTFRATAVLITRERFAGLAVAPIGAGFTGRSVPISRERFSLEDTY
ncbi:MAG: hypothetical protein OJF49_004573 [Ktedonobacterales bacterium]|jgi:hypothetical protein|nr:MAG: hypothetical protein OJF49_004573 [Ktedonobacterales bacterium]